ncbi:MAG: translation initiation factor IF-2 subunit gamma [Nanoarchaeota archaeon]
MSEKKANTDESLINLPVMNVGIVGHIDHGKTTLLQKLSGKWTDTHSEEMKRGITIRLGYADVLLHKDGNGYNVKSGTPFRHINFVDAPGHEMLMATMLSGAAIIDAAILVVAANEGIKPQTREHVMALQAKRIKNLIVVQNKIDLIEKEVAKKNYSEVMEFLKGKFENITVIPVSAQQEINIDKVYEALAEIPIETRKSEGNPVFIIARSFDINKPGTSVEGLHGAVLGGTLKQGILKVGEEIEIKPGIAVKEMNQVRYHALNAKILKLFNGSREVKELIPGGSMSIETSMDMSLAKGDALAGCVVSTKGNLPETTLNLRIKFNLFPEVFGLGEKMKVEPLKPSENLLISVNTSMALGMIKRIQKSEFEINLKTPIVPFKGENVALSRSINGHWRLIGYGEIL